MVTDRRYNAHLFDFIQPEWIRRFALSFRMDWKKD